MKVENNVAECQALEQHSQRKKKNEGSFTSTISLSYVRILYTKTNYSFIFCLWLNTVYVLDYPCFSIIPHLLSTTTPDNQQYTVLCCKSELFSSYAKRVRYIFMIVVRHITI